MRTGSKIETFKEILVGDIGKAELLNRLVDKGIQFNKYANLLFDNPEFMPPDQVQRMDLVKVNLSDLNFNKPAIYQDIVTNAEDLGFKLCPLILAAYLRLEYFDQSEGPYLKVASPKVGSGDNYPRGLYLRNISNTFWLRGYCASDDWEYSLDTEFIFQR